VHLYKELTAKDTCAAFKNPEHKPLSLSLSLTLQPHKAADLRSDPLQVQSEVVPMQSTPPERLLMETWRSWLD